ncbi:MAG: orotate phosphoribosyltransferase [Candidatus Bathyarchaeia archaeon]
MSDIVSKVAYALYNSGCLKFGTFKIKSGALSPYYIDLASLLSSPKDLSTIVDIAAEKINEIRKTEKIDQLASIELKGALILPSIACRVKLPCTIVRKEDKTYGVTGRIAGANVAKDENILFFDDVITEGLSKLEGIKSLEMHGANVKNVMVVVDREEGGKENLDKLGYKVHALAKVSELVDFLFQTEQISKEQRDAVMNYAKKDKNALATEIKGGQN